MLADLRDSGSLEQEADIVAFLYRDGYYSPDSCPEPDLTEFIIMAHRNGPTGTAKLRFQKEFTLFVPYRRRIAVFVTFACHFRHWLRRCRRGHDTSVTSIFVLALVGPISVPNADPSARSAPLAGLF